MPRIRLFREPQLDARYEAYSYQSEALKAVRDLDYAAIFVEQGLGKSKIAIDLILYWLEKKLIDTVLYVTKKSLIHNCEKEFATHTYIKPKILSQNSKDNYYVFNSPSRLILTHFEVLKSEYERFQLFLKARDIAVILDESAKIKNPDSFLTQAFFELAPSFKKRVIMTGTPVVNRPYDIWAQIWFLDQGKSLGNDFLEFKQKADLANKLSEEEGSRLAFESFLQGLFSKISKFTVRTTKGSGVIELPTKEIRSIMADWEHNQYELYKQVQKEMRAIVLKDGIPSEDKSEEALKRLLRLVQIASNPRLVDEGYRSSPGKLEPLKDIISSIVTKKEKCILWTSFTGNVEWLAREFIAFGACKIHGKMTIERRNRMIDTFLSDDEYRILIATPGAGKEGLTLTVANNVIYYDRTFGLDDYLQSQDRIHRISQKKKCYIYNLILKDSIDEWVNMLLESKHLAAQLAQGDISLEYYRSQMSYDFGVIIKEILGIE